MDKTELLYDHYKETVKVSTDMQAKRNTLFVYVCVFELLNFLMLLFPQVINSALSTFLLETYKVSVGELLGLLPTGIWLITTYVLVRYFQTTIYVERQYPYIEAIEAEIAKETKLSCFDRESKAYLSNYPKVLDLIHIFYTWMIPVLLQIINTVKIVLEWKSMSGMVATWVNTVIYAFLLVLTVLFLIFMHRSTQPVNQSNKQ
jgi:hypothetical protein